MLVSGQVEVLICLSIQKHKLRRIEKKLGVAKKLSKLEKIANAASLGVKFLLNFRSPHANVWRVD